MIYLDSAATTLQKPSAVPAAMARAVQRMASPGRGGHRPAMLAAETAFACRPCRRQTAVCVAGMAGRSAGSRDVFNSGLSADASGGR